jgi:hypothetical protein
MRSRLRTLRGRRRCGYTQRAQVETVASMLKRNLTDELAATTYAAQCREMRWLAIVHNILILLFSPRVFDGANRKPLVLPPGIPGQCLDAGSQQATAPLSLAAGPIRHF